jgi:D-glycero-D-manno-heptose 1,7-bisphosphate phosphatase
LAQPNDLRRGASGLNEGHARLKRAVFLDRDGVLIEPLVVDGRPFPPQREADLVVTPGTAAACRQLRKASLLLIVVTNQPDIARGRQSREVVDAMHATLTRELSLDAIYVCPHDDADACSCRKPKPGMLLDAARTLAIDLGRSVMVGDRWRDIEAGQRAGCATVLVDRGYDERAANRPDVTVSSLAEAVPWILGSVGFNQEVAA